ncbi:MAG: hypothetical protein K6G90_12355 [Clostridia bacterium]|nr:hypothetical protein [Clostridia bacterium]
MQGRLKVPVNKSAQTIIQIIAVIYLTVWSVAPPLQMDMIFRLAALGLAFLWFAIEFFSRFEFTRIQIFCAIFMVGVAIIAYVQNGAGAVMGEIAVYMMVLSYFINIYSTDKWQNYRLVVPIAIGLLIFFNYRTASELSRDATIARLLVRDSEELYGYMKRGVGGYGLVYPQVLIAPVVYGWTLKSFVQNKLYFVLGVCWIVSFWALILNAGYSIAIISSAVSFIILLFYRRRGILPAFIITVALVVLIFVLLVYAEGFRNIVLRIFDGTKVVRKIEDLLSTAEGETADSFATRVTRYWVSIRSSLQYPIIGGILFGASTGGHSEILDTFSRYGLWGGVPTLIMIFHTPISFKVEYNSRTITAVANAHTIAIALVALFDPFVFQVYFPLLVLCPVMYSDILKWAGEKHEDPLDSQSGAA